MTTGRTVKRTIFFLCYLHSVFLSLGQTVQKTRKAVQVMPQQTFYLNGGLRASFGGKSRTYYQIDLPNNTVEWYYMFSTASAENKDAGSVNLVPQLSRIFDPTGLTSIVAS